jgi:hypothetical protein
MNPILIAVAIFSVILLGVGVYFYTRSQSSALVEPPYFELSEPTYEFTSRGTASASISLVSVAGGYDKLTSLRLDVFEVTSVATFRKVNDLDVLGKLVIGDPKYTIPDLYPGSAYTIKVTSTNSSGTVSREKNITIEKSTIKTDGALIEVTPDIIKVSFPDASNVSKTIGDTTLKTYNISVKVGDISAYNKTIDISPSQMIIHEISSGIFSMDTDYDVYISSSDFASAKIGQFRRVAPTPIAPDMLLSLSGDDIFVFPSSLNVDGVQVHNYEIKNSVKDKLKSAGFTEMKNNYNEPLFKFQVNRIYFTPIAGESAKYRIFYKNDVNDTTVTLPSQNSKPGDVAFNPKLTNSDMMIEIPGKPKPDLTIEVKKPDTV